jgi:hypothetical protein
MRSSAIACYVFFSAQMKSATQMNSMQTHRLLTEKKRTALVIQVLFALCTELARIIESLHRMELFADLTDFYLFYKFSIVLDYNLSPPTFLNRIPKPIAILVN